MQRARTSTFSIASLLFLAIAFMPGCQSITVYDGKANLRSVALTDYGIVFEIPGAWDISLSRDRYFQFVAVYREDSRPLAVLEYRGLDTEPRDKRSRDLYATGWYDAMRLNYPGWKYRDRSKDEASEAFTFEGSYLEGTTRYIKIGKLRFKDRRIHAIYYTAPEEEMDHLRDIFEAIDEEIRY
ncbi:MAG: hypothetical protein KDK25_12190 [Leptospiraceae bacterium]|nr:hypothetical protein [Leptospiraceae bacterium]MCB1171092.1 hypothetical protein [Leptospiraceae bacterium]